LHNQNLKHTLSKNFCPAAQKDRRVFEVWKILLYVGCRFDLFSQTNSCGKDDDGQNRRFAFVRLSPPFMIETDCLKLVPAELAHFEAILNDQDELARLLRVSLADEWYGFDEALEAMPHSLELLKLNPALRHWWTYLFVHKRDSKLVGIGGFKGAPDAAGMVEIGYAIAPAYRRKGLATEAARGLLAFAFAHESVMSVQAHTLKDGFESIGVLRKVGMRLAGKFYDAEDGDVLRWIITRDEWQSVDKKTDGKRRFLAQMRIGKSRKRIK
jgi:ribosomal-protein-alanine N-acetyltransferase